MDKHLIFIQTTRDKFDYLKKAREMGYKVIVAQKNFSNQDNIADYVIDVDPRNLDELVIEISRYAQGKRIDGVLTLHELAVEETALIAKLLGLPGLSVEGAMICRNKYLTRLVLQKNMFLQPKFELVKNIEEAEEIAEKIGYPVIIKPLKFAGSCGVMRVNSSDELRSIKKKLVYDRKNSTFQNILTDKVENYWLIEEYLDGFEISVQAITHNGATNIVAIHDKVVPMEGPNFAEEFIVTPSSRITLELEEKIVNSTINILNTLQFDFGVSHVEFRIVNGEPILLEANARLGGGTTNDIVYHSTGINLYKTLLQLVSGEKIDIKVENRKCVAVSRIHFTSEGIIEHVSGINEAREVPGVVLIKQWLTEGDIVRTITTDVGGAVLAVGTTCEEALTTAKFAASIVNFKIKHAKETISCL